MKKIKPRLSFWQIWNMSFGFLGIQFGFSLQNANVSRIFQTLGANIDDIPILWIAAPLTGLIVQPIIGYYSDKTWSRFGRRRPYFLVGALLASLALFIMPNSPMLWIAAGTLWIMDASINVSMEPFRAFVGDMLPEKQRTNGFVMQSFFIGLGAVVGSALPYMMTEWFNISNIAPEGVIPDTVKYSFYIGGLVFFLSVLWTVLRTKEYSPEELKAFDMTEKSVDISHENSDSLVSTKNKLAVLFIFLGIILTLFFYFFEWEKETYILSGGLLFFGLLNLIAASFEKNKKNNGIVEIMNDMVKMPKTMIQLAFVQFFTWFSLFAMWIYSTSAITEHIYGTTDQTTAVWNEGANWVGVCFAAYNGFAALVAFLLPILAKFTNRKITHLISLTAGGLGLISIYFIQSPDLLLISFFGVGLAWASILSMPYAILTGALPSNKMGIYMGIFNFFIVIPQILAASLLGIITKHLFDNQAIFTLVTGGIFMIIAGWMMLLVKDDH